MDLKYLQKVIKMLDSSNLAEIEIEEEGTKLKLSKPRTKVYSGMTQMMSQPQEVNVQQSTPAIKEETEVSIQKTEEKPNENLYEVRSRW